MQLLLDTHIMLGLAEPENFPLPQKLYERLLSGPESLFVSTASLWEIAIKNRLGKLLFYVDHKFSIYSECNLIA